MPKIMHVAKIGTRAVHAMTFRLYLDNQKPMIYVLVEFDDGTKAEWRCEHDTIEYKFDIRSQGDKLFN